MSDPLGIERLIDEMRLRAEYEFEQMWLRMDESGTLTPVAQGLKKFIKPIYLYGAECAVISMLEKIAEDLGVDNG